MDTKRLYIFLRCNAILAAILCATLATAAPDCEFIARVGAQATQRSGNCMIGQAKSDGEEHKQGHERCVDNDNQPVAELDWKDGKRSGSGWYRDYNDSRLNFTFADDQANGPAKVIGKDGRLGCEMTMKGNKAEGVVKAYHPDGKLAAAFLFTHGEHAGPRIKLATDGSITELICAPQSMVAEDRAPCGYDGREVRTSLISSFGGKQTERGVLVHKSGKLIARETRDSKDRKVIDTFTQSGEERNYTTVVYATDGSIFQRYTIASGDYDGNFEELASDGKPLRRAKFAKGKPLEDLRYWLNGQIKLKASYSADRALLTLEDFWDNGKPKLRGTFRRGDSSGIYHEYLSESRYAEPLGAVTRWRDDGGIVEEANYVDGKLDGMRKLIDDKGVRTEETYLKGVRNHLRRFDASGALILEEEYFPDGSRKQLSPPAKIGG